MCTEEMKAAQREALAALGLPPGDCGCKDKKERPTFTGGRLLPDGSILYPKKGWEPPPDIEGYVRDPKNAWHFINAWNACDFRIKMPFTKPCGAIGMRAICNHLESPLRGQDVEADQCRACPLHK